MANWRTSNASDQHEFLSAENALPASESEKNKHVTVYREMLLAGATKVIYLGFLPTALASNFHQTTVTGQHHL